MQQAAAQAACQLDAPIKLVRETIDLDESSGNMRRGTCPAA
jgi:hypothetical protein